MGQRYFYKCCNCDYQAELSKGVDFGFYAFVDQYVCNDCKELVGVLIEFYGEIIPSNEIDNHKEKDELYKCPECNGSNIDKWNLRKRCPKCNGKIKIGKESIIMWD